LEAELTGGAVGGMGMPAKTAGSGIGKLGGGIGAIISRPLNIGSCGGCEGKAVVAAAVVAGAAELPGGFQGDLFGVEAPDRLNLSPVPKMGTCAATGVGEVMVDGGDEMSELTSLGGGAYAPENGGDGLGDVRAAPNWL